MSPGNADERRPVNPPGTRSVCADCSSRWSEQVLMHSDTCPALAASEMVSQADREWFARHPTALDYRRPLAAAEVGELRTMGVIPDAPGEAVGRVTVRQVSPGVRVRDYRHIFFILHVAGGRS